MKEPTIFDKAIFAHSQWKHRLRQAIETGESEWTVADVRSDKGCEFGKWLDDLPPAKKTPQRYSDLRSLHAEFHKAASEVLTLALSGKKNAAQVAMASGSHFRVISAKLVLDLRDLAKSDGES